MPKARRTSPVLGLRLASVPGGGVFHDLFEAGFRVLRQVMLSFLAMGLLTGFTMAIICGPFIGHSRLVVVIGLVASIAVILFIYRTVRRANDEMSSLILGLQGERMVAALVAELGAEGYIVLHNLVVPSPEGVPVGNIDHVLIGPAGLYCVETKVRSKRDGVTPAINAEGDRVLVDGRAPPGDPVNQVRAASRRVAHRLATSGIKMPVGSMVLFPGRYVTRTSQSEVFVANPKEVFSYLRSKPVILTTAQVKACFQALLPCASTQADDPNDD